MDEARGPLDLRALIRTQGARPSRSAETARARRLEELRALTVEERMLLALRLGRRDRAIRGAFRGTGVDR